MKKMPLIPLLLCLSPMTFAEKRHHSAHVHGRGKANIAIDTAKATLEAEFKISNHDIFGFEHKPTSQKDKAIAKKYSKLLENHRNILKLPASAHCRLVKLESQKEFEHEETHHHGHKDHGHHKKQQQEGEHSETHLKVSYKCKTIKALNQVEFTFFQHFPKSESLKVQVITTQKAFSKKVTRKNNTVSLQK